ncbi:MAG TPA: helix-turn-helix domain-containing protein [Rhizomicrobium sp.]|nr:helix-turn-helix domain-containing protein [Rhizomicrobium sp.]
MKSAKPAAKAPRRADAQRNIEALLKAAMAVFAKSGVDAPVRDIAEKAGVGVGTVYRHFPQRSDLIVALFRHEVDACADAAAALSSKYPPTEALSRWLLRFTEFVAAKRGLATALHAGDPAYEPLRAYYDSRLRPAMAALLNCAAAAGEIRADVPPGDLLSAAVSLCRPAYDVAPDHTRRMLGLLIDGLRYGAVRER